MPSKGFPRVFSLPLGFPRHNKVRSQFEPKFPHILLSACLDPVIYQRWTSPPNFFQLPIRERERKRCAHTKKDMSLGSGSVKSHVSLKANFLPKLTLVLFCRWPSKFGQRRTILRKRFRFSRGAILRNLKNLVGRKIYSFMFEFFNLPFTTQPIFQIDSN